MPAAPLSFNGTLTGCCGHPAPDRFMVSEGVPKVRIQKLPAARVTAQTMHMNMSGPGVVLSGSRTSSSTASGVLDEQRKKTANTPRL
jgi:hypothetical protein